MAAVMASKPQAPFKMKRPSQPHVQTSTASARPTNPSPSPSSATKRLPGQNQTPSSATSNAPLTNLIARPSRRPQRVQTRTNTDGPVGADRRTALKDPEPYVSSEAHILKKYRGSPPSLIVHLHPMHFRFDQQDGSFSYQSEMRLFIEHLQKKTVPHDMLEEFRKSGVRFYDGWLIVRVVDHKSVAKAAATTGAEAEDDKPFSIHNYNTFITPSAYVPYPKQQSTSKSPVMKHENGATAGKQVNGDHPSSSTVNGEPSSDDIARPSTKPGKPQPRTFHVALRPTNLSKHMDLVLASMDIDPKSTLNRKQSQLFNSARTPGSAGTMAAPLSLDTSLAGDKGLVSKKRKLRIAPEQMINFERAVVNHTAPPLCLDLVNSLEEAELLMLSQRDPLYDQEPPSPKSRKRTVAELAADDALAKEQERFMLIMAERDGGGAGATAGVVDGQASGAMFQPDFGKFNTIQQIKFQAAEKQKREEERRMHDDANKRLHEEERKRTQEIMRVQAQQAAQQQNAERQRAAQLQEHRKNQAAAAQHNQQQQQIVQQQIQAHQAQQAQANAQQMAQINGVPPNMQNQIRQGQPMSSPVMRQSTPHGNSSPIANSGQPQAVPMATQGSQQGMAGSPPRPGSAIQHGHPGVPMARGPSNQGPSRNGTPQLPQNTPAMRQATPVMRQGTPAQRMSQASPHPGMMAPTPQMNQAQMMAQGQPMPNGMHYPQNAQQLAQMQQRHNMQQAAMQQGMMAGTPQFAQAQAQMAHIQAQRQASNDQQAAILQQRQRQAQQAAQHAQMQAAQQQQIGTPQQTAPSPANSAQHAQNQYSQNLRNQLQNQMQQVGNHGSPTPSQGQPTPQQQMAQLQRQQQQQVPQAGPMNPQLAQQGMQMNPQQQQMMRNAQMQQQMQQQAQFGNLNPQQQQHLAQQMMMQQQRQGPMNPQQMAAMQQQQQQQQQQQRPVYPPQVQQNMAKIRDNRIGFHTNDVAMKKYGGNANLVQPLEHQEIRRLAMIDAQTWARKWQAQQHQRAMVQQQAQMQAQMQAQAGAGVGVGGMPQ